MYGFDSSPRDTRYGPAQGVETTFVGEGEEIGNRLWKARLLER